LADASILREVRGIARVRCTHIGRLASALHLFRDQ
jgi:hypothetical protein